MKRRLDLALALVHRIATTLFLDEPTTGLDPQSRSALWEEVARLASDEGVQTVFLTTQYLGEADVLADRIGIDRICGRMTVFLTTQYLEEADVLADRIGIIDRGRIVPRAHPML